MVESLGGWHTAAEAEVKKRLRLRPRTLRQTLCRRPDCSKDQGGINLDTFPCLTSSPYNDDAQVTLLLSEQDVNLVGDNLEGKENGVTKLLRVIILIAF